MMTVWLPSKVTMWLTNKISSTLGSYFYSLNSIRNLTCIALLLISYCHHSGNWERIHFAPLLLYYSLQKCYLNKSCIFIKHRTICGASVSPASHVCVSIMVVLLTVEHSNVWCWSGLWWHNVHTKFYENWLTLSKFKIERHKETAWWTHQLTTYFNKEQQAIKALKQCGNKFIFHSFVFNSVCWQLPW